MTRKPRQFSTRVQIGEYTFTKKGIRRFDLRDPYHLAVTLTWPQFLAAMAGLYLTVNCLFAMLYLVVPGALANAHPGSFSDAFFFSFETLATVGYGEIYPGSLYGHLISSTEIMCGLAFTAILTGLTFVRFSRPRAKFIFADNPVVAQHNGKPMLMLRVANGRANSMGATTAKMNVLLSSTTVEGKTFRSAYELKLVRQHLPIFPLTWTVMHELGEASPIHNMDSAALIAADARIFITLESHDPVLTANVNDLRSYAPGDIKFGMHYVDAVGEGPDGTPEVDLTAISEIEPENGVPSTGAWDNDHVVAAEP